MEFHRSALDRLGSADDTALYTRISHLSYDNQTCDGAKVFYYIRITEDIRLAVYVILSLICNFYQLNI